LSRKVNELNRSVQTLTRGASRAGLASNPDVAPADKGAVL
jgi:hypothetical protein